MPKSWILVIEDDAALRSSVIDLLELEGYICQAAENGNKAFDIIIKASYMPQVVLLDLMMPLCSGYEFIQRLRNDIRYRAIPLIIFSAAPDAKETAIAYQADFIRKPADSDTLLNAIERFV